VRTLLLSLALLLGGVAASVPAAPVGVLDVIRAGRDLNDWVHARPGRAVNVFYKSGKCEVQLIEGADEPFPVATYGRGANLVDAVKDAFKR